MMSGNRWKLQAALPLFGALALLVATTSCASGPKPPEPGTPAFFWGSAQESYRGGDMARTDEQLQKVLASDNEFSARARVWDIVISAGLAQGHSEMADVLET